LFGQVDGVLFHWVRVGPESLIFKKHVTIH
jgi:hypothetical protein